MSAEEEFTPACDRSVDADLVGEPNKASPIPRLLHLDAAHRIATGRGVMVGVVDTGVASDLPDVTVRPDALKITSQPLVDAHGTLLAGLIGGDGDLKGMAPDATIQSLRVLDTEPESEDQIGLESKNVVTAIDKAISLYGQGLRVINLSFALEKRDPAVEAAIKRATKRGILVVASVGNRPPEDDGGSSYQYGEDAVKFPATMDQVLAVTSSTHEGEFDPSAVMTGTAVDVSAPALFALTRMPDGSKCFIPDLGSSYATAMVSGLAALLFEEFPNYSPAQVRTRIEATARGAMNDSTELYGHGMIQPEEALSAQLRISKNGELTSPDRYVAPRQDLGPAALPEDSGPEQKRTMVWWGMGAGAALLLGLLLRPLLSRRAAR